MRPPPRQFHASAPCDAASILVTAHELERQLETGVVTRLLKGRRVALVRADSGAPPDDLTFVDEAIAALGVRLSHIRPNLFQLSRSVDAEHIARILGRLYDAIVTGDMVPVTARHLSDKAGIPVVDDATTSDLRRLAQEADWPGPPLPENAKHRLLVQAFFLRLLA